MPEQKQMINEKDEKKKMEKEIERKEVETPEKDKEIKEPQIEESLKEVEKEIKKEVEKKVEETKVKAAKGKTIETPKEYKEFTIPLREKVRPVPRYKKANKAVKTIKEFLARHMKIYDRDLNKIKLEKSINEFVWARGIKNPPHKIKVKAFKDGELVRVELVEVPKKITLRRAREEKREKKAVEGIGKKKVSAKEKKEKVEETKETSEDIKEEKEKKASVAEEGKKMEKQAAKQIKHQSGGKTKEKTQPHRKALSR